MDKPGNKNLAFDPVVSILIFHIPLLEFQDAWDAIQNGEVDSSDFLGENREELGASEYLKCLFALEKGTPPQIDLEEEKRVHEVCIAAASQGILQSAHDVSEGGLAVCLAESSFLSEEKIGLNVDLQDEMRTDMLLFGETQSRIVVTVKSHDIQRLIELARKKKVKATPIGSTGGKKIVISHNNQRIVKLTVEEAYRAWKDIIPEVFQIK